MLLHVNVTADAPELDVVVFKHHRQRRGNNHAHRAHDARASVTQKELVLLDASVSTNDTVLDRYVVSRINHR